MKKESAKFAVVRTAFHKGGTIKFHRSIREAQKTAIANLHPGCMCQCCEIFPLNKEGVAELLTYYQYLASTHGLSLQEILPRVHRNGNYEWDPTYYNELKDYMDGNESPYQFIR